MWIINVKKLEILYFLENIEFVYINKIDLIEVLIKKNNFFWEYLRIPCP